MLTQNVHCVRKMCAQQKPNGRLSTGWKFSLNDAQLNVEISTKHMFHETMSKVTFIYYQKRFLITLTWPPLISLLICLSLVKWILWSTQGKYHKWLSHLGSVCGLSLFLVRLANFYSENVNVPRLDQSLFCQCFIMTSCS